MAIFDSSDFTFNGEEVKALSEVILEDFYKNPTLSEFHTLVSGIKAKKQIALLGTLGLVGRKQTGCTPLNNTGTVPGTEKFWEPERVSDRFSQCFDDFKESFFVYSLKNGVQKEDLTSTDVAVFLNHVIGEAMKESVHRIAWFGDKDAALVTDSPAGNITDGTDLDYFNLIDGLWKQLFAIATAYTDRRTTIAKNTGNSYANQRFNDTDTGNEVVTKIFQLMIDDCDERLIDSGMAVIYATRSLVQQYKKERKAKSGIDLAYQRTEKGMEFIEVDGVRVYPYAFWDRTIKAYFDNGTKLYYPHRAVLTVKTNVQIGTEEESNLSEMDAFYDKKTKTYNVDFAYNLDAKIIEDYKVQVAY